ncbi:C40 family peptidase [Curtobacterium ammoniigenes]|uniref:C40 family peptidase n=1 Tax=Curtobacterium ammoniigenes TaxID=395387 RepID=UPI0009FB1EAF|nr:NlpC/P60 family protein [Curtobacterium ammoniigenes]
MAGRHALPEAAPTRRSQHTSSGPALRRSTFTPVEPPRPRRARRAVESPSLPGRALPEPALPQPAVLSRKAIRVECARRVKHAKRVAHVLAPLMALTSGLGFALPASASPLHPASAGAAHTVPNLASQHFQVSSGVTVPVIENGQATVISTPTLVVGWGTSVPQAKTVVTNALSMGGDRAKIIDAALAYLGDPYVEGGASHSGIDCSGLVMVAYASVGIQLAHYVPSQDAVATTIPESEALPGDLVVYDSEAHIGIYLGDGLVLQAPHPGEPVDIIGMFPAAHHFARILPAGQ